MREIVVATRNKNKMLEICEILKDLNVRLISLKNYPMIRTIEEDGKSFDENAIKKAVTVARETRHLTMADDSGLEVDFLDGEPGVRSSRFAGDKAKMNENIAKLLKLLNGVPLKNRKAAFRCSIAIADKDGLIKIVHGRCPGIIGFECKGTSGFGYDPLFIVPGYDKTFAELGADVKNRISHRARALAKAKEVIRERLKITSNYTEMSF